MAGCCDDGGVDAVTLCALLGTFTEADAATVGLSNLKFVARSAAGGCVLATDLEGALPSLCDEVEALPAGTSVSVVGVDVAGDCVVSPVPLSACEQLAAVPNGVAVTLLGFDAAGDCVQAAPTVVPTCEDIQDCVGPMLAGVGFVYDDAGNQWDTGVVAAGTVLTADGVGGAAWAAGASPTWTGVAGNGATVTAGGVQGHSPTISARLSTDVGNAASFGSDTGLMVGARTVASWEAAQVPALGGCYSVAQLGDVIVDASGRLRTAPTKSVPVVFTSAQSTADAIALAGPHAINSVIVTSPTVVTTITNANPDKSLQTMIVPVNYGTRHMLNLGGVAAGQYRYRYEMLCNIGGVPVTVISAPSVFGIGRLAAVPNGVSQVEGYCEVRGEAQSLTAVIPPCGSISVQHLTRITNVGSTIPTTFSSGLANDARGFLQIVAIPRKDN